MNVAVVQQNSLQLDGIISKEDPRKGGHRNGVFQSPLEVVKVEAVAQLFERAFHAGHLPDNNGIRTVHELLEVGRRGNGNGTEADMDDLSMVSPAD